MTTLILAYPPVDILPQMPTLVKRLSTILCTEFSTAKECYCKPARAREARRARARGRRPISGSSAPGLPTAAVLQNRVVLSGRAARGAACHSRFVGVSLLRGVFRPPTSKQGILYNWAPLPVRALRLRPCPCGWSLRVARSPRVARWLPWALPALARGYRAQRSRERQRCALVCKGACLIFRTSPFRNFCNYFITPSGARQPHILKWTISVRRGAASPPA